MSKVGLMQRIVRQVILRDLEVNGYHSIGSWTELTEVLALVRERDDLEFQGSHLTVTEAYERHCRHLKIGIVKLRKKSKEKT